MRDCAASIQAVRFRVGRLDTDGTPLAGAGNMIVSKSLIRLGFTPQYEEGQETRQKNGAGELCLQYKEEDTLAGVDLTVVVCTPDPDLHVFMAGGELLMDGDDVVGYKMPEVGAVPNPNGVSIEAWSRARVGGTDPERPFIRWIFPKFKGRIGEKNLANEAQDNTFTGRSEENPNWGDGPANDLATITEDTVERAGQWIRDFDVPAASCAPMALAAS